jgi:hypothetical protein
MYPSPASLGLLVSFGGRGVAGLTSPAYPGKKARIGSSASDTPVGAWGGAGAALVMETGQSRATTPRILSHNMAIPGQRYMRPSMCATWFVAV